MFTRKRTRPLIRAADYRKLITVDHANKPDGSQFKVVSDIDVADEVVGLDSIVAFTELASGVVKTVQVVEPEKSDAASLKISALTPLGQVLMGLVPGDRIEWQLSQDAYRILEITTVIRTPIGNEVKDDE